MTLPAKFAERVLRDLGDSEGAALCAALDTEQPVSVRLNPAKCGGTENGGAGREEDADKAARRAGVLEPIKTVGEYEAVAKLHREVRATIRFSVNAAE